MENISIGLLCTLIGIIISFLTFQRNNKKEIEADTKEFVELKSHLGYISRGVDDIKFNDRIRDEQLKSLNERLIIVENETKILFRRFERLDEQYHIRDELDRADKRDHK